MDEIIAVDGWIFTCSLINLICLLSVPIDVGDDRRDNLASIIQLQIFVETLGFLSSCWVSEIHIAHFAFVIDREDDIIDLVDVVFFPSSEVLQTFQINFQLVVGIVLHAADGIAFASQIPFSLLSFRIVDGNLVTISLCQGSECNHYCKE